MNTYKIESLIYGVREHSHYNGDIECEIGTQQGDEYRNENTGMSCQKGTRDGNYTIDRDIKVST